MKTPEFEGHELVYSCNGEGPAGAVKATTCDHSNLMTYQEDGDRFCACRDCGSIWELVSKSESEQQPSYPLTDEAYVAKKGGVCPYCGFDEIEGDGVDIDGNGAFQEITCGRCHMTWTDVYELKGFLTHEATEEEVKRAVALRDTVECDECGAFIHDTPDGPLANKHHEEDCSLYDPDQD